MTTNTDKQTELMVDVMLGAIEDGMKQAINEINYPPYHEMYTMLAYHLGWMEAGTPTASKGKRIRPLLVTLTTEAAGGSWEKAIPAAVAVELIHNFSLIHDDIEDNSPLRRGRPTVWKKWGIPQAINAGDAMFTQAHLSMLELKSRVPEAKALEAARLLQVTCLALTQGQFLDLFYETQDNLKVDDYWPMIKGKTAALLSAATRLGALIAGADPEIQTAYGRFGESLGLAFQVKDDLLGIWGKPEETGKSAHSDLLEGKKSLPVLYGLGQGGQFATRWSQGPLEVEEVPAMAAQLEAEGGLDYTQRIAAELTQAARTALQDANPGGPGGQALLRLADQLLKRAA